MLPLSAPELATRLVDELSNAIALDDIRIDEPPQWLAGTVLELSVATGDWQEVVDILGDLSKQSPLVHGFWKDQGAIWLHMGLDVWQSTRLDRFSGSRILTAANNDPINSTKRMQTLKLVQIDSHVKRKKSTLTPAATLSSVQLTVYQTMAHFLRASLRLGARDISKVVRLLAKYEVD